MLVTASMCHKFSIVTVLRNIVPLIEENAKICGISDKLASVKAIGVPVLDLQNDPEKMVAALFEEGRRAVEADGAEALILGCTGMTGIAEKFANKLGVFVVDQLPTAVKFSETLESLGLSHSKLAYPVPPEKKRITLVKHHLRTFYVPFHRFFTVPPAHPRN